MTILIYTGVALVVCLVQVLLTAWYTRQLRCTRELSCSTAFAGESGEMIETVGNYSPFLIPWLRLESHISSNLQLGRQDSLQSLHASYYVSLFTLMPYQQIRRVHQIHFLRRGEYTLGGAALTCGDLMGVTRFGFTLEESPSVLVYPALLDDEHMPALLSQQLGDISRRRQLMEDPFLVRGLRAYQPGDPVRDIHWPATARTGQVQVRLHEYSARSKLLVILNVQGEDMQWQGRLPEKLIPRMEHAISLTATACVRALEAGMSVGFTANASVSESKDCLMLPPAEGAAAGEILLSNLARLRTTRNVLFSIYLKELSVQSDLDILILSCYDNEEIRQARQALESQGCQVTFYQIEGGAV